MGWRRYWSYLKYITRHKFYVFMECARHGILWRGLMHDMSKFLPSEFIPYAKYFYYPDGSSTMERKPAFSHLERKWEDDMNAAWLAHQHRNPHHWQHWILRSDDGGVQCMPMPEVYAMEMVCDWRGCGKALGFHAAGECSAFYKKNKEKIKLHPDTEMFVERMMIEWGY